MVLQDHERDILLRDDIPFAPVESTRQAPPPLLERLATASQQWRLPLTLLFGTLIAVAAFFAYQSQRSGDDREAAAPGSTSPGGGLAVVVDGMGEDDDGTAPAEPSTTGLAGASSAAPSGPTTSRLSTSVTSLTATTRAGSSSTGRASTTLRSAGTGATTVAPGSTTASSSASSAASSTASSAAATSTQPPSTTASQPPSSAATVPITTVATQPPTTPSSTAAPRPVFMGDKVTYDDWDGAGVKGIVVTLLRDADRNGVGEGAQATATTSDSGGYSFSVEAGCYVVSFAVPNGQQVLKGERLKPVCLTSGQDDARIDLVLSRPSVRAPGACEVQTGSNSLAGVEIQDSSGNFAPSYAFYDRSGRLLFSTSSLGGPDDTERFPIPSIEWTSRGFRYEESDVYSVAAEDGLGNTSSRVTCRRLAV